MDNKNITLSWFCTHEILAEFVFYKGQASVLLICTRLFAEQLPSETNVDSPRDTEDDTSIMVQDRFNRLGVEGLSVELITKWLKYWDENWVKIIYDSWYIKYYNLSDDELKMNIVDLYTKHYDLQYAAECANYFQSIGRIDCSNNNPSSVAVSEEETSRWRSYWEEHHYDFVIRTWIEKYGIEGWEIHGEEVFRQHCAEQYVKLYLQYIKEYHTTNDVDDDGDNDDEVGDIWDLELFFKQMCIKNVNPGLIGVYQVLSLMGYNIFEGQQTFDTAFAQFLDPDFIKDTDNYYHMCKLPRLPKGRSTAADKDLSVEELLLSLDDPSKDNSSAPEAIFSYIAKRFNTNVIVDGFCGAGRNAIQFSKTCRLVIAIDIDPKKIEMARKNAELQGVTDRIQFIVGDYFVLAPTLQADIVFLSPPWGGRDYLAFEDYKLSYLMPDNGGGEHLLSVTQKITSNIVLHLPKNINIFDILKSADTQYIEVQQNMLDAIYHSVTVYYNIGYRDIAWA